MTPLGEELTQEEKLYLNSLTMHDGWPILVRILNEACKKATEDVIKIDPQIEGYERKLAAAQNTARAKNQFCTDVLKTISWRITEGINELEAEAEKEEHRRAPN